MEMSSPAPSQQQQQQQQPIPYWCHQCSARVTIPRRDDNGTGDSQQLPTCPRCGGEFVEEIEDDGDNGNDLFGMGGLGPHAFFGGGGGGSDSDHDGQGRRSQMGATVAMRIGGSGGRTFEFRLGQDQQRPPDILSMLFNALGGGSGGDLRQRRRAHAGDRHEGGESDDDDDDERDDYSDSDGDSEGEEQERDGASGQQASQLYHSPFAAMLSTLLGGEVGAFPMGPMFVGGVGGGGAQRRGRSIQIGDYVFGNLDDAISQLMQSFDGPVGTPPASKEAIEGLVEHVVTQEDVDAGRDCSVCQELYKAGESTRQMPCGHIYHKDCLVPWLERHNNCPVCRYELPTDDPDYERQKRQRQQQQNAQSSNDSGSSGNDRNDSGDGSAGANLSYFA